MEGKREGITVTGNKLQKHHGSTPRWTLVHRRPLTWARRTNRPMDNRVTHEVLAEGYRGEERSKGVGEGYSTVAYH